jgi:GNAT superfamily N-acetyltransferase
MARRVQSPGAGYIPRMNDRVVEERRGELLLSTDRARLDLDGVLALLHASHWGASVTMPNLSRAVANSVCVGIYEADENVPAAGRQVAFARAVTDLATFAYLTDVIVDSDARGQGIGKWIVSTYLAHPDLQGLRRFALLTRDAQTLYAQFGFAPNAGPSTYMEIKYAAAAGSSAR